MYTLVLGADGPDSTGLTIIMETLHRIWPKGRHVAIVPKNPCPWVGTASNASTGAAPSIEHSKEAQKELGWKDFYVAKCPPVDCMYYALENHKSLLGFDNPFDLVIAGIHHGAVLGLDTLHAADVVAAGICSRTYGVPGLCFAQAMATPKSGSVDRRQFAMSQRVVQNLIHTLAPMPGECLVVNVPAENPVGPANSIIADYHPNYPAPTAPFNKGPKTDIRVIEDKYISIAEFNLNVNPSVRA